MEPKQQFDPNQPLGSSFGSGEPDTDAVVEVPAEPTGEVVAWEASEHVHYEKNSGWFVAVGLIGLALALLSWFLLKSLTFTILIIVMTVAAVVMAYRPPRTIRYQLDNAGIQIEEKRYLFKDFRAFGVLQEGAMYYLMLLPVKRIMPAVTVYFPADQGERIVDVVGARVPMEKIELDFIDKFTQRLRF